MSWRFGGISTANVPSACTVVFKYIRVKLLAISSADKLQSTKKIILNCNVYISSIDNANDPLYSDEIVGISSGDGFRTIGQFRVFHRFAIGRHHFDVFHGKLFLAMHRELCDQRIEHYLGLGEIGRRGLNEDVLRIQSDLRMIAVDNRWQ